jgi:hypothetical protein
MDVLCSTVCSDSFKYADIKNRNVVTLTLKDFFLIFLKKEERLRRRQGN